MRGSGPARRQKAGPIAGWLRVLALHRAVGAERRVISREDGGGQQVYWVRKGRSSLPHLVCTPLPYLQTLFLWVQPFDVDHTHYYLRGPLLYHPVAICNLGWSLKMCGEAEGHRAARFLVGNLLLHFSRLWH